MLGVCVLVHMGVCVCLLLQQRNHQLRFRCREQRAGHGGERGGGGGGAWKAGGQCDLCVCTDFLLCVCVCVCP